MSSGWHRARKAASLPAASAAIALLALALAPSAVPTPGRGMPGNVVLGKGIGQVRLGMTSASALRVLRKHTTPILIGTIKRRSGALYIEYEYRIPDEFGAPAYTLGIEGRRGKRRVVLIETMLARHRTPEGVGVGSTISNLLRTYGRRLRCGEREGRQAGTFCNLDSGRARKTVFFIPSETTIIGQAPDDSPPRVTTVIVQESALQRLS